MALHLFFVQPSGVFGQSFSSGSTGSDGALNLTDTSAPIIFNPADYTPPLDPDGDGIYHFTTITVAQGVTVRFRADVLGSKPVQWLATGKVQIDGTLDLHGENGHAWNGPRKPSVAGAGGYGGGRGGTGVQGAENGDGPGGGNPGGGYGGAGGHATSGNSCGGGNGGSSYGSSFLLPLLGGSGGGGGGSLGSGGGAGGGALLIASSNTISIAGGVYAYGGGPGAYSSFVGGGGSGGAIRLVAPSISGNGQLNALGGDCGGSPGRIRLEAFPSGFDFTGSVNPTAFIASPVRALPGPNVPKLRVSAVGAVPVPNSPTGSFAMPDVTIDQITPVTLMIEAKNIPLGTVVKLRITPENGAVISADSTPLAGTLAASTATADVTLPPGFARFFVTATWNP